MAMKIASRCKACCSSQKVHFDSNHFDPPCNNKCSRKKMAASVGEKPTLSKPVMMMMVSTLAAPHLFDHYRRIVLSVGQIIALRKTESFFLVFLCKSPLVHTFRIS